MKLGEHQLSLVLESKLRELIRVQSFDAISGKVAAFAALVAHPPPVGRAKVVDFDDVTNVQHQATDRQLAVIVVITAN